MNLTIDIGPNKSGKTQRLYQEVVKALKEGKKVGLYSPHSEEVIQFLYSVHKDCGQFWGNLETAGDFIEGGARFFDDAHQILRNEFEPQEGDYFTFPESHQSDILDKLNRLNTNK